MNTCAPIRAGRMLTGPLVFQVLLALSVAIIAAAAEPSEQQGGSKLKVMTYNVYAGTKYAGATDPNPGLFLQAMTNAVLDVRASDPTGRAQALARQIVAYSPHLVSLQEVFTVSTGPSKDELTVEFDYLQLLQQALAAQGAHYAPVESVETWTATVPTTFGYSRASWRIVILARTDLKDEHFYVTNVDGAQFLARISYPLAALNGSPDCPNLTTNSPCLMPWPRGWAYADVNYRGHQFRFVDATLESNSTSKNIAQGVELLNGALNTPKPVVLAADLNCDLNNPSDPKLPTCQNILKAGFVDAWEAARTSEPGFTKELPTMSMRGDYVMSRGLFDVESAALAGANPADKTASGLWPSNHAGVVTKFYRPD